LVFHFSESGKLLTWGSADDMGQSYVTAGKHEVRNSIDALCFPAPREKAQDLSLKIKYHTSQETPEAFPLPSGVAIVRADAGWAHCVAITGISDPGL